MINYTSLENKNVEFASLTKDKYDDFFVQCQNIKQPPILPNNYSNNLWGVVALENKKLIGGWVGQKRGNVPIVKYFTQGIWFDSLPLFFLDNTKISHTIGIINYAKKLAKENGIVLFNVTHWSRQKIEDTKIIDSPSKNASFILDLNIERQLLLKNVERRLKRNIVKGQKQGLEFFALKGEEALSHLETFQNLRKGTQKRAISNNAESSILLKSDVFIKNILLDYCSYFCIVKSNTKIVAINLMIQSGKSMYGYYGGSDMEANKKMGAYSFLLWKSIEFAQDNKLECFDLGGTPINPETNHPAYGVYFFKKSFGGDYREFDSGKIIIRPFRYRMLNMILNNQFILRSISKKE